MLPVFARTTYVSENALMPATADPRFSEVDASYALKVADRLQQLVDSSSNKHKTLEDWLLGRLSHLGVDTYVHPFPPPEMQLGSRFGWASHRQGRQSESAAGSADNKTGGWDPGLGASSCEVRGVASLESCSAAGLDGNTPGMAAGIPMKKRPGGVNVVGIVRAPQGEGNEAMVLVTPFNVSEEGLNEADALGLGVGLALLKVFSELSWLAKDYVWIAADAAYGVHYPVNQWLKEYHSSAVKCAMHDPLNGSSMDFKWAGVISAGLVLEVERTFRGGALNRVKLLTEGGNGKMPNQDLINTAHYTSTWREGVRLEMDKQEEVERSAVAMFIGSVLETVTKTIRWAVTGIIGHDGGGDGKEHWLQEFLKAIPSITAGGYVEGLATLTQFMQNQALGVPTGAHGAFGNYVIDAMTLRAMAANPHATAKVGPTAARQRRIEQIESVRKIGRYKFHESSLTVFSLFACRT
ncbi:hypothetical protein CBR_g49194 [Chara braunii]|uniref:Uncharacterized protein n=1 Tax=Chara braunii TaxID=69332 RepID=A0A388M490_CHABU|nr:hypothetical protein CBR_g49194 [Chara braunii]|eukprot:GBG89404.1 hypothetical protein CBR_g49194 [Chara braunii]